MGLDQHVHFPTHVPGHTLNLVLSQNGSSLNAQQVSLGPSFSDHQTTKFTLDAEKPPIVTENTIKRKWPELNVEIFFQDLDLNNLTVDSEDLAEYMDKLNERITFNLDNQIPLKVKRVSKVNSHP